jgi:hypothetical protein
MSSLTDITAKLIGNTQVAIGGSNTGNTLKSIINAFATEDPLDRELKEIQLKTAKLNEALTLRRLNEDTSFKEVLNKLKVENAKLEQQKLQQSIEANKYTLERTKKKDEQAATEKAKAEKQKQTINNILLTENDKVINNKFSVKDLVKEITRQITQEEVDMDEDSSKAFLAELFKDYDPATGTGTKIKDKYNTNALTKDEQEFYSDLNALGRKPKSHDVFNVFNKHFKRVLDKDNKVSYVFKGQANNIQDLNNFASSYNNTLRENNEFLKEANKLMPQNGVSSNFEANLATKGMRSVLKENEDRIANIVKQYQNKYNSYNERQKNLNALIAKYQKPKTVTKTIIDKVLKSQNEIKEMTDKIKPALIKKAIKDAGGNPDNPDSTVLKAAMTKVDNAIANIIARAEARRKELEEQQKAIEERKKKEQEKKQKIETFKIEERIKTKEAIRLEKAKRALKKNDN